MADRIYSASPFAPANAFDVRAVLFVAILAVAWISAHPFGDLSAIEMIDLSTGHDFEIYAEFAIFAAISMSYAVRTDRPALKALLRPAFIALAAWILLTCITSQDPATSLKRAVMFASVAATTAALFLLPRDKRQFTDLLLIAVSLVVGLSYFGVIFLPQYSIHQITDVVEARLAGDWRGIFAHKNEASAMFAFFTFFGLYLARSSRPFAGAVIALASIVFVLESGGKSSAALSILTIAATSLAPRFNGPFLFVTILLAPFAALNLLGVGSVIVPSLGALTAALMSDPTFTGRADIWTYAVAKAASSPVLGYGFMAFWNTESTRYGSDDPNSWAGGVSHAHNGFVDGALGMGLLGLALVLWAFVVQPTMDFRRAARPGADNALVLLAARIWLFGVYLASFESFFFDRANPIFVTFLFAVFALRYLAAFEVKD